MYYIGFDIGSSSIKAALIAANTGKTITVLSEPSKEMEIEALQPDWAEQDPEIWWKHLCTASKRIIKEANVDSNKILGIGISYQMHGLVVVDKAGTPLRKAIIWCDSRAVTIGNNAFAALGTQKCSDQLLNSPGNFTASKLKWVLDNEPEIYQKIYKYMLPGDYIGYKLTNEICTTKNGLSEGILWDYQKHNVANWLLDHFGIDTTLTPAIVNNFEDQGKLTVKASKETGLPIGIPIKYRAGDQPNNALSLNIFNPGEVAATGGTSGVLYAVTDKVTSKETSRINSFAHVNYSDEQPTIGKLLCINGAGIQYRWLKDNAVEDSYEAMNLKASQIAVGSEGLAVIPFGNGAERMLNNKNVGTHFANLNLNTHHSGHLYRAALEGIAFSFVYGMEILKGDQAVIDVIRAGNDNLFRSDIFSSTIATLIDHEIEIYDTTGAVGAARAASIDNGDISQFNTFLSGNDHITTYTPEKDQAAFAEAYQHWKQQLKILLNHT